MKIAQRYLILPYVTYFIVQYIFEAETIESPRNHVSVDYYIAISHLLLGYQSEHSFQVDANFCLSVRPGKHSKFPGKCKADHQSKLLCSSTLGIP